MKGRCSLTEIIDEKTIKEIKRILKNGERIELIPSKYGVKVMHVKRKEIKLND